MQFPLGVICDLLHDKGISVLKEPSNPNIEVSWVTAMTEDVRRAPSENIAYVVGNSLDIPPGGLGIVVKPSLSPDQVPAEARNTIYAVSSQKSALIADLLQQELLGIIRWNERMGAMLEAGRTTKDFLQESQSVLQRYVGLSDSTFSYIAHTPDVAPIDGFSEYFVAHKHYDLDFIERLRRGLVRNVASHGGVTVQPQNPYFDKPTIECVFKRRGNYAGHLVLVSSTQLRQKDVFLFKLLASKVDRCLAQHWQRENPLEQRYTYFLKRILSGNTLYGADLSEEASIHGLPSHGLFRLLLIDKTWKTGSPEFFAKTIIDKQPNCKVAIEGNRIAVLICATDEHQGRVAQIEEDLFAFAVEMDVEVGVSEKFESLSDTPLELEKARIALTYGHKYAPRYRSLGSDESYTESIFKFKRYFPYFATDPFAQKEQFMTELLKSSNPLRKLKDRDRERGTNDFEILRMYLRLNGKIGDVCKIMHTHRNTISYRLEKIRKELGMQLDDPDNRMYLRILYLLMD